MYFIYIFFYYYYVHYANDFFVCCNYQSFSLYLQNAIIILFVYLSTSEQMIKLAESFQKRFLIGQIYVQKTVYTRTLVYFNR